MQSQNFGISLLELLVSLAIVLIVSMGLTSTNVSSWRQKILVDNAMQEIMGAISMARLHAIAENIHVTICPSFDGQGCQGNWNNEIIIFTDRESDLIINDNDRILSRSVGNRLPGDIRYNSFQNKRYLQMTPTGFTDFQNGNFTFCSMDGDPTRIRQIILSLSGRTRYAQDRNGDGVVENSQGRPVACD